MVFKIRTLVLSEPRSQEDLLLILGGPLKKFTFQELAKATNNFSNKNIVGRGGFGKVYRGILWDGSVVAVKRLKEEGTQSGELQFQKEVEIGTSEASDHRNVLQLRGYCMTRKERVLVYPFMVNTSVASRLRERQPSEPPLDWATRKRIALGAAKGLAHFHSGCSSFTVIHRDVKAANILLDDQFEAVLCDFGLAKFVGRNSNEELIPSAGSSWVRRPMEEDNEDPFEVEESEDEDRHRFTVSCWNLTKTLMIKPDYGDEAREGTKRSCWGGSEAQAEANSDFIQVTTAVRGTVGHIAPEYLCTGKCSVKSDVFGYGVTLLELISGQRAFGIACLANDDDVMLLDWIRGLMRDNKLEVVVDSDLSGDYKKEEVEHLLEVALLCTQGLPMDRPVMPEVVRMIENLGNRPLLDELIGRRKELLVQRLSPEKEKYWLVESPAHSVTESDWMIWGRS